MNLSRSAKRLIGQGMFQIKSSTESLERDGADLIHFEIGDPQFRIPKRVEKAMIRSIKRGETHYTDPLGIYELRELISKIHDCNIGEVCVCPANFAIFALLSILCNPGDRINYPIPGFPTYKAVSNFLGLKHAKNKVKVIIHNSPNNPTGEMFAVGSREWLICDNVYRGLEFNKLKYSGGITDGNRLIQIYSLSKSHAMTGIRVGYVIAPEEIIKKLGLMIETTYSCLPEFTQRAAIAALKGPVEYYSPLLEKRNKLVSGLKALGYDLEFPDGGIYAWVRVKDSDAEYKRLLSAGVVVCPGTVFGSKKHIRLCFAVSDKDIEEGLRRIKCVL